jgi:hypothetical protein
VKALEIPNPHKFNTYRLENYFSKATDTQLGLPKKKQFLNVWHLFSVLVNYLYSLGERDPIWGEEMEWEMREEGKCLFAANARNS